MTTTRRAALFALVACAASALALTLVQAQPQPPEPSEKPVLAIAPVGNIPVVIPQACYQSVVISPVQTGGRADPTISLPFIIRSQDAIGRVSDFTLMARIGEPCTLTFPLGWRPSTDCLLLAPNDTIFAAWGVTNAPGGGGLIAFEPLERDPNRETRDRARERDFEEFLRERQRNR